MLSRTLPTQVADHIRERILVRRAGPGRADRRGRRRRRARRQPAHAAQRAADPDLRGPAGAEPVQEHARRPPDGARRLRDLHAAQRAGGDGLPARRERAPTARHGGAWTRRSRGCGRAADARPGRDEGRRLRLPRRRHRARRPRPPARPLPDAARPDPALPEPDGDARLPARRDRGSTPSWPTRSAPATPSAPNGSAAPTTRATARRCAPTYPKNPIRGLTLNISDSSKVRVITEPVCGRVRVGRCALWPTLRA